MMIRTPLRIRRRAALAAGGLLAGLLTACQAPRGAEPSTDDPSGGPAAAAAPAPPEKREGGGLFGLFKKPKARPGKGEAWAIRVAAFRGEQRLDQAENCAEQLRHATGIDAEQVQILHEREQSTVYYGAYARTYDPATDHESFDPDPRRELDLIRSLSMEVADVQGNPHTIWPFQFATVESLPGASDGDAIREDWDLANADGYYSLQIAVFYNTDDMQQRKQAAEEYCKLLRAEGEQAYYHHGASNSSVFVGTFPESAIQDVSETDPLSGAVQVKRRITDPEMLRLQEKYPHNLHNGHIAYDLVKDPRTGQKVRDPHVSFAVTVPNESDEDWGAGLGVQ